MAAAATARDTRAAADRAAIIMAVITAAGRAAQPDVLRPLGPGQHGKMALQCHVEGIILQPLPVFGREIQRLFPVPLPAPVKGPLQQGKAGLVDGPVVRPPGVVPPVLPVNLLLSEQAVLDQRVQVDVVRVSGKGGEGLVGGVPVAGGAYREQLPAALAPRGQEVREFVGLRPQGPDPVGGGQGGNGH